MHGRTDGSRVMDHEVLFCDITCNYSTGTEISCHLDGLANLHIYFGALRYATVANVIHTMCETAVPRSGGTCIELNRRRSPSRVECQELLYVYARSFLYKSRLTNSPLSDDQISDMITIGMM